jgi:hypothetical protein
MKCHLCQRKLKLIDDKFFQVVLSCPEDHCEIIIKGDSVVEYKLDGTLVKANDNFLKFMNLNLIFYKNQKKVWHISGWNYNVNFNIEEDAYFTRGMNCWGWGTWRDRWKYFEKKPNVIIKSWTKNKIFRFNFDNSINFFSQIIE